MTPYRPLSWRAPHMTKKLSHLVYNTRLLRAVDWLFIALISAFITVTSISLATLTITILLLPCLLFHSILTRHWVSVGFYMLAALWVESIAAYPPGIHALYAVMIILLTLKKAYLWERPFWYQWVACCLSLVLYTLLLIIFTSTLTSLLSLSLSIIITTLLYPILCCIPPWSTQFTPIKGTL